MTLVENQGFYKNITLNDVQLASAYYPILIDLAKHKHTLTYGELVERAKREYPEKEVVQNAIAVSTGRKLDVVRLFTEERELPDLTSLIINKGAGECGSGFTAHFDPIATRQQVFTYDWSSVSSDFDGFIDHTQKSVTPRKKIKKTEALKMMSAYYKENKSNLPDTIASSRDYIVEQIMEGFTPEEAFNEAIQRAI